MRVDLKALRSYKIPFLGLVITLLAIGGYYSFVVQDKAGSMRSRNFRLLNLLSEQVAATLNNRTEVITNLVKDQEKWGQLEQKKAAARRWLNGFVDLRELESEEVAQSCRPETQAYWERDRGGDRLRIISCVPGGGYRADFDLDRVLERVIRLGLERDAFEAILLATTEGVVVLQKGESELRLTQLESLFEEAAVSDEGNTKAPKFATLARSTNEAEVILSGTRYRLFLQPLRSAIAVSGSPEAGWVMCGLVSHQKFFYRSLAFSPSIVALVMGGLLIAIFSWPFLKLSLIGAYQRVTLLDAWLVGFCGLLGVALLTLSGLDLIAYSKLKGDFATRLRQFSEEMRCRMSDEVRSAYQQLTVLERAALKVSAADKLERELSVSRAELNGAKLDFREFFLVDRGGQQRAKWSRAEALETGDDYRLKPQGATPLIPVADREYFKATSLPDLAWPAPGGESYYMESLRSRAGGDERVVIAKPIEEKTEPHQELAGEKARPLKQARPVAALAVSMRSLIAPAAIPGFRYALIDASGKVLFHSDQKRNRLENFILEADGDGELKAAIATLAEARLSLSYEGNDYLAYIAPIRELPQVPWFLITYYPKKWVQTLNVELLVNALQFLGFYGLGYALVGLVIALRRPQYRAIWLWPDSRRKPDYDLLSRSYLILIPLFCAVLYFLHHDLLLLAAWLLPGGILWATYAKLQAAPEPEAKARPGVAASYKRMLVLLLLLVAVLPTAAFFKIAAEIHTETYARHAQLKLAQEVQRKQPGQENHQVVYSNFFLGTRLTALATGRDAGECGRLLKMLVKMLPVYFDFSIERFGLLEDETSDGRWRWGRGRGGELVLEKQSGTANEWSPVITTGKVRPLMIEEWAPEDVKYIVALILLAGALWAVLFGVVWFVGQCIFLIDLHARKFSELVDQELSYRGRNLILVCQGVRPPSLTAGGCIDFKERPTGGPGHWRRRLSEALDSTGLSDIIVVNNFDFAMYDEALTATKLAILEELVNVHLRTVVVISRADPTLMLAAAKRQRDLPGNGRSSTSVPSEQWQNVLSCFRLLDYDGVPRLVGGPGGAEQSRSRGQGRWRQVEEEYGCDPFLRRIWSEVEKVCFSFEPEQVIEELGERAECYYRGLWNSCATEEKLVLQHLAATGMVNWKDRKTIRRLMERGLILQKPHFQLPSEPFRRFVLSTFCREDVAPVEAILVSTWDSVKWPFSFVLIVAVSFFYMTQRELFNLTTALITGVTGSLPVLVKLAGNLTAGRSDGAKLSG